MPGVVDEEQFRLEVARVPRGEPRRARAIRRSRPPAAWSSSSAFQQRLFDAGLAGIAWPEAYGGRGLPGRYQRSFDREAAAFRMPPKSLEIGLGMCGPTILAHGTEEQKRALIPPLLRGEHVWCELFSEPGAGSDLASVQMQARPDGDTWVLDGQKVWTSGAHNSDFAACLRGPIATAPSAKASRCSSSTCTRPA